MYTCITRIKSLPHFLDKNSWKTHMVTHFAPESCPLRKYNFALMDKHGHHFFRLKFVRPDTGWLFHTYQTKEEYFGSVSLRLEQQQEFQEWGMEYDIFDPKGV
jgi:hypothetical protein